MAASQLLPAAGAVTFAASLNSDFGSFELGESQQTESVAAYGAAVYDPYRGSGTPHTSGSVAAFVKGHAATTNPFGSGGSLTDADGASATFTVDTNHTYALSIVVSGVRMMHARLRAAIPITFSWEGAADPTVSWASS